MKRRLALLLVGLAVLIIVGVGVVLANQTAQLIELADRVSPRVGDVAFWTLLVLYAFCLGVPAFILLTLPAPLKPPAAAEGPAYERHLERLARRLRKNPRVSGAPRSVPEIQAALAELDVVADARTKAAAAQVFISTAISQNGSLDALLVLAAQSKLVLEIARTYYQRPTLRDLAYLYGNVAATAFIAAELEDVDLTEQVQPILTAILGSTAGAIPGLAPAASLFVNSVTTGAGNAFLTLRVGIITRQYCRSLVQPERRTVRRAAAVQATGMLGGIASEGAAHVASAIWARPRRYFSELIESTGHRVTSVSDAMKAKSAAAWDSLAGRLRRPGELP